MISQIFSEADFQFRYLVLSAPFHRAPPDHALKIGSRVLNDDAVAAIKADRVARIDDFLSAPLLAEVQKDLAAAFAGEKAGVDIHDQPDGGHRQAHVIKPMLVNDRLAAMAFDPEVLELVSYMIGRDAKLVDVDMRRLYPASMEMLAETNASIRKGYSNTCWHYDARGRQVKIQVYLTDVTADDQNFSYLPGTGGGVKMTTLQYTRFSDEWAARRPAAPIEIFGPAGTGMIFDTRIVHRVRRKATRQRDSVTFYYHAGFTQKMPVYVSRELYDSLDARLRDNLVPVDR